MASKPHICEACKAYKPTTPKPWGRCVSRKAQGLRADDGYYKPDYGCRFWTQKGKRS